MAVVSSNCRPDKRCDADGTIEHVRLLFESNPDNASSTIFAYKELLRVIFDKSPILAQSCKVSGRDDGRTVTALMPTYLCLQCSGTNSAANRDRHGMAKKHML